MDQKKILLAADVGGSNARLALFTQSSGYFETLIQKKYFVKDYPSLESIVKKFIEDVPHEIHAASFAVAAPVLEGKAKFSNLDWIIEENTLKNILSGIPIALINDLIGLSSSIPLLKSEDVVDINIGEPNRNAVISVIAPGTGLGEGFLINFNGEYVAASSEGGNADFAPKNELQYNLLKFLQNKYGYVSYEQACSGKAIPDIYQFLKENGEIEESIKLSNLLTTAKDPGATILNSAMDLKDPDPLSFSTMKLFVQILASEAGNLALKTMSTGGVFIAGGIPPRIIPMIKKYFMKSFCDKGRYRYIMESIPVKIIIHPQPGLLGAARYGFLNLLG